MQRARRLFVFVLAGVMLLTFPLFSWTRRARTPWTPSSALAKLDVITINVPAVREIAPWIATYFPHVRTYSLDIQTNAFTTQGLTFPRNMFPKEKSESEYPVIPDWYVTDQRTVSQRVRQLQQGMDVNRVLRHWHDTFCKGGDDIPGGSSRASPVRIFAFVEDDFLPCLGEQGNFEEMLRWARAHPDKWSSVRWTYGLGGMLLQCRDLPALTGFLKAHETQPGVDWVLDRFFKVSWGRHCALPGCQARRPFVMNRATTYHGGNGRSVIWDGKVQTEGGGRLEAAGCIALRGGPEYYEGYDAGACGKQGLLSPCDDESMVPRPSVWTSVLGRSVPS
jgi:hypothetical protein